MNIITLGPSGTFSHEAAKTHFSDREIEFAANFDVLFDRVSAEGKLGFVPFENSLHGSVDEALDLLLESNLHVWKTFEVHIDHALGGTDPNQIQTVASHLQALSQCRKFLKKHYPDAERFPVSSTAYAIDLALADPTVAAIASKRTMEEQGLPIIEEKVHENGNTTRFAVIAKEDPFPEDEKTEVGIVFHPTGDKPGLLHDILTPFKVYNVNFTRIENRPTGNRFGDYNFFLHFQGNSQDAYVQQALAELEAMEGVEIVKMIGEW